ncbi:unnamed protein product [Closterium sp. NIES-65]|nr:unnamed protein product [Closterium sp. NIES-65]
MRLVEDPATVSHGPYHRRLIKMFAKKPLAPPKLLPVNPLSFALIPLLSPFHPSVRLSAPTRAATAIVACMNVSCPQDAACAEDSSNFPFCKCNGTLTLINGAYVPGEINGSCVPAMDGQVVATSVLLFATAKYVPASPVVLRGAIPNRTCVNLPAPRAPYPALLLLSSARPCVHRTPPTRVAAGVVAKALSMSCLTATAPKGTVIARAARASSTGSTCCGSTGSTCCGSTGSTGAGSGACETACPANSVCVGESTGATCNCVVGYTKVLLLFSFAPLLVSFSPLPSCSFHSLSRHPFPHPPCPPPHTTPVVDMCKNVSCPAKWNCSSSASIAKCSCPDACYGVKYPDVSTCAVQFGTAVCQCPMPYTRLINNACLSADLPHSDYLDMRNHARAAVGAVPLEWDNTSLTNASNKCYVVHRGHDNEGQNLVVTAPSGWALNARGVHFWVDEGQWYSVDVFPNSCEGGWEKCGHYTQLVWNDTRKVGCAKASCAPSAAVWGGGSTADVWACHYYPPGNGFGHLPFVQDPFYRVQCLSTATCTVVDKKPLCVCAAGQALVNNYKCLSSAQTPLPVPFPPPPLPIHPPHQRWTCVRSSAAHPTATAHLPLALPSAPAQVIATVPSAPAQVIAVEPSVLDQVLATKMHACYGVKCPDVSTCVVQFGTAVCKCPAPFSRLIDNVCSSADLAHSDYLDVHNNARAAVGAVPLVWDDAVAEHAQAWATALTNTS